MNVKSVQDVYAQQLICADPRRGYPLWIPEPNEQLPPEYRDEGHRIGDVGVVTEDGGFDVFFNICLPPTHPLHSTYGVPEDFKQTVLSPRDISRLRSADHPGSVVATQSITQTNLMFGASGGSTSPTLPIHGGLGIQFDSTATEGAILVLPAGSCQESLRNHQIFFTEASVKGKSWYKFAVTRTGRMISSDSLYLITGCYKTSSWSLAAFHNSEKTANFNAHFTASNIIDGNVTAAYKWAVTTTIPCRVGPDPHDGNKNQTLFIRGYKIAIRQSIFLAYLRGDLAISYKPPNPVSQASPLKHREINKLGMAREDSSQASKGGGAVVTRRQDDPVDFPQSSGCSPAIQNVFEFDDLSLYQVPPIAKIYHPSDLINQLLLDKDLSCDIAVTHDDMWVAIVGHLPSDQDGQNDVAEAIKHECSKYTVMSYSGAAYFSPCNMPDTRTGLPDRGHFVHYDGSVPADISYLLAGTVGSLQKENSQASKHNNCPPRMCSYDQGGNECGQLITCGTVPEHFSTVHIKNFAHNIRIACMWRGCGHIVARKNFVRHIREAHLGHERTAGRRYQIPDSVGTSANRPSSLAENPALPMTQPAPSLAQPSLDPHTDEFMIETSVTSMTEMPAEMYMLEDSWGEDDVVISQNKHMQMTCSPPAPGATNVGSLIFGSCGRDVAHDENMGAV